LLSEKLFHYEKIEDFDKMGLKDEILRGIYSLGFERPLMIQQKAIVPMTSGKDIIGQAQSGTGKTATFTIGMLQRLDMTLNEVQALILCPTRELARQNARVVTLLGDYMDVKVGTFIGGTNVQEDLDVIESGIHVAVATPGRVMDLLEKKALDLRKLICFVLDEADEMLSKGFKDSIYEIYSFIPETCQICLFSATMPKVALEMTKLFMKEPLQILIKQEEINLDGIRQFYIDCEQESNKIEVICDLYDTMNIAQSLIFCNSRRRVEWIRDELKEREFPVSASHGELPPNERMRIFQEFKGGQTRVLVTTDLLSRGIDVQGVSLVINYELPLDFEKYVHRIGRAGRFGKKGVAINLVCKKEIEKLFEIEKRLETKVLEMPKNIADYLE